MKKLALLSCCSLLAATLLACGPDYDRTEISNTVTGKLGGTIDKARVTVPEGSILKAHIVPYNTDDKVMSCAVHSADERVVEIAHVVTTDDWAFLGVTAGTTTIDVKAEGKTVLILEAVVTPQPAPP